MALDSNECFWRKRAATTRLKAGVGHWLAQFLPLWLGSSVAFAAAMLILRRGKCDTLWAWAIYFGAMGLGAVGGFLVSRKCFFSTGQALAQLDAELHLYNRLTSAMAGIGPWPDPVAKVEDGFHWQWRKILPLPAASILLVLAAAKMPLPASVGEPAHPVNLPVSLAQVESWINTLQSDGVTQPEALEELKRRMEDLQKQGEWYQHSSLEAADSLRQATEGAIKELENHLENASHSLNELAALGNEGAESQDLNSQLQNAIKGMEGGKLPFNKELLQQLKNVDVKNLKQLSSKQLQELKQSLDQKLGTCQQCTGAQKKEGIAQLPAGTATAPGSGGTGGGGPPAPLTAKDSSTDLRTTKTEAVSNGDLSRATPGDLMGVGKGSHETDKNAYAGPVRSGAAALPGVGGETVWKDSPTPEESEILQRYFK